MALWGFAVGLLDRLVGVSYGVELLLMGAGIVICLNLSHRHAGIPR
jgi:hypothetical protein